MKVIDTKGRLCPEPLIMAKKAFTALSDGESIEIISDNDTSCSNLMRFLTDTNANPKLTKVGNVFRIICSKGGGTTMEDVVAEKYCEIPVKVKTSNYVISISSNKMGKGEDELGEILMKAFINTIKELDNLPAKIVFYNSGVLLTQETSSVIDSLTSLETSGINILICGTCADYFEIKRNINIGEISNMYDIGNTLVNAEKVVTP